MTSSYQTIATSIDTGYDITDGPGSLLGPSASHHGVCRSIIAGMLNQQVTHHRLGSSHEVAQRRTLYIVCEFAAVGMQLCFVNVPSLAPEGRVELEPRQWQ